MTPRVSVLLPTRGRCGLLPGALGQILDLAADPDGIEIIMRVDEDDSQCQAYFDNAGRYRARMIVGPRLGYKRMHEYWKELGDAATGTWLLNWNDDATMLTSRWDEALASGPPLTIQFLRRDKFEFADTSFPAMSRDLFLAVGRMADNCHTDDWLGKVAEMAGVRVDRNDIVFRHDQEFGLTDEDIDRFLRQGTQRAEDAAKIVECRRKAGL